MRPIVIEKLVPDNSDEYLSRLHRIYPSDLICKLVDFACYERGEYPFEPVLSSETESNRHRKNYRNFRINFYKEHRPDGIFIGEVFGINGIEVDNIDKSYEILQNRYGKDAIILFEMEEIALQLDCPDKLKYIFEKYDLLFTEIREACYGEIEALYHTDWAFVLQRWPDFFKERSIIPKQIFVYHINLGQQQYVTDYNFKVLSPAPMFWCSNLAWFCNAPFATNQDIRQKKLDNILEDKKTYKKRLVLPINKPKAMRLELLYAFDRYKLLADADWSLVLHPGSKRAITSARGYLDFIKKYENVLPKTLENSDLSDIVSKNFIGLMNSTELVHDSNYVYHNWLDDYKYYVAAEAVIDKDNNFSSITEKVFKGFLGGFDIIPVSRVDFVKEIEKLGFKLPTANMLNYDMIHNTKSRIDRLAKNLTILPDTNTSNSRAENFERFTNIEEASNACFSPLHEIRNLI